jgi:hypothetical protein
MVCLLNRKPYRDRWGNVRVRPERQCCKQKTNCSLSNQPVGDLKKSGGPIKRRKVKTDGVGKKG